MPSWEAYDRWNQAVLDVVFPESDLPEPVYLDFEDEVAEALSARLDVAADRIPEELAKVVATTLRAGGPATIFASHMWRLRSWQRDGRPGPPPFVALLSTFSIAAEQMAAGEGMAVSNYFGRLRRLLGWEADDHRVDQGYRRVAEQLWGALNSWLLDLDGRRGLPTAFAFSHRYVGLPISQALVREGDRERFKDFFRQYGFAPGAEVAHSQLAPILDSWIGQHPCPISANLARLWKDRAARERIAQAAAVALAAWDGSVRSVNRRGEGATRAQGHLRLTLEVGRFPRRRFSVRALFYLPDATTAREATVLTSDPQSTLDLVPDVPGALGPGMTSTLQPGDVLEGILKVRDEATGIVMERRPQRMVLFREDELTRRWIENPQVMLGDNVRLLVQEDLVPRLREVLNVIARPGWTIEDEPYPGQPEGWRLVTNVEVFSSPGSLVRSEKIDDLQPLVPLTTSQLKVAGGLALPGQIKGKWHTWAPPEVRAVSDNRDGFEVRLYDLHRYSASDDPDTEIATLLEVWPDEGKGVVVAPLAELEDGDYRVDLVGNDSKSGMSVMVRLRSSDTPDARQWALLNPVRYGPGLGVLGVDRPGASTQGVVVDAPTPFEPADVDIPSTPWWTLGKSASRAQAARAVRLTMPDPDSCLYSGRHHEVVDTVEVDGQGRPLVAWSYGRCKGCGLERKYPTRLRRSSFDQRRNSDTTAPGPMRDVAALPPVEGGEDSEGWETAFDALLHTGGGSWSQFERIAVQVQPTALFVDEFARTLEALGHIDIRRDPRSLEPIGWEVSPTALAGTVDGYFFVGYWPGGLYSSVGQEFEKVGGSISVHPNAVRLGSYFVDLDECQLSDVLEGDSQAYVVPRAWQNLAHELPALGALVDNLPRQSADIVGDVTWYQPRENSWVSVRDCQAIGGYRARRFSTVDFVRTQSDLDSGTIARSTVQLSKHAAALMTAKPLLAYEPQSQELVVPLGADLPGLYGRAVVIASGEAPTPDPRQRRLVYHKVPAELAGHLYDLFSR